MVSFMLPATLLEEFHKLSGICERNDDIWRRTKLMSQGADEVLDPSHPDSQNPGVHKNLSLEFSKLGQEHAVKKQDALDIGDKEAFANHHHAAQLMFKKAWHHGSLADSLLKAHPEYHHDAY